MFLFLWYIYYVEAIYCLGGMIVLRFECDYLEGAHPKILEKLLTTNSEQTSGYGVDPYCESAKDKIRKACECQQADIFFMVGGTQANATVIAGLLSTYEGVIAVNTGHINVHEAGAIEANGHKVLPLPHHDGKMAASDLRNYLKSFSEDESNGHMVAPGMVYISHPTEYGTLYTASELSELHEICQGYGIPLFLDGARLGYGLAAQDTDVTLPILTKYCDVFTIGGTKVGALFGEAVVVPQPGRIPHFFTVMKQHGAVLAKGRLLGLQFDTLFTDGLYFAISRHADEMAGKMESGFRNKGYTMYIETPTNQKFVLLDNTKMQELKKKAGFSFWEKADDTHAVVRFATSWATREEDIDALLALL